MRSKASWNVFVPPQHWAQILADVNVAFMLLWREVTVESADSCTNDTWLQQYFRTTEAFAADSNVKTDWELASRVRGVKLPQVHRQHEQTSRRACGIETSALMTEQVTETTDISTKGA